MFEKENPSVFCFAKSISPYTVEPFCKSIKVCAGAWVYWVVFMRERMEAYFNVWFNVYVTGVNKNGNKKVAGLRQQNLAT